MSHVALTDESCKHTNQSCQKNRWVMSHMFICVRTRHVSFICVPWHMNEPCRTHEGVISHISTSLATHTSESCHTVLSRAPACVWVMSHIQTSHVTRKNESRRTHTSESCHTVLSRAPACVWTGCRLPTNESRQPTARDTCLNESYHTDQWVMSHIRKRSAKRMDEPQITAADCPRHLPEWVMSLIWMKHVTHKNASWRTYEW